MSDAATTLLVGAATILLSVLGSAIVIGIFLGSLKSDMRGMNDRLAKIEGMFTLTLRQDQNK